MMFHVRGSRNPDTSYRTAFLEQVRAYDPSWIGIVVEPEDLIDPEGPVAISNLPLNSYHLKLVNSVRYIDGTQLFPVPGTTGTDLPIVENPRPVVNTPVTIEGFEGETGQAE